MNAKDKKELAKRRKEAAKQAQQYHKSQEKLEKQKKAAAKPKKPKKDKPKKDTKPKEVKGVKGSKIKEAVNSGKASGYANLSREEKFRRESEERIRNLKPQDFEDGYYIDEYAEKQRQKKKLKIIRKQEREVIKRNKKPMTQKQIRKRRIIISAGIFLSVLVIGIVLSLTVLFKTEKIEIEGDKYYYEKQITAFSNVSLQQNIFIAALNSTPEKISENLPYVEKAEISVAIPDTVVIKITNATPSYAVKDGDGYLIISSKGRILEKAKSNEKNLTELVCSDFESKEPGDYVQFTDSNVPEILESVATSLKDNKVKNVTSLNVKNLNDIQFNYDNHILVKLGLPEDLDYKIKTAMKIITEKLDPNKTGAIYGTLDVSTCAKNKVSHYKPAETEPPTTEPETTEPTTVAETTAAYDYGTGTYDYGSGSTYDYGNSYNNGGSTYDYGNSYNNGGSTYDYGNSYGGGNTYDYSGNAYGNGTGGYTWDGGYNAYNAYQ